MAAFCRARHSAKGFSIQNVDPRTGQTAIAHLTKTTPTTAMVIIKATPNSEKGLPSAEVMSKMFEKMGAFNEKLAKAGVMKDGDGLRPSKYGKRVTFTAGSKRSVTDGPFAE